MKLKSVVATAVLAAASFSASATAYDLGVLDPDGFDTLIKSSIKLGANAQINDTWSFKLLAPSSTSFLAAQTFAVQDGAITDFAAVLNSTSFGLTGGAGSQSLSWSGLLAAGTYSVTVTGTTGLAGARYSANVSAIPAVPEPATYGMMLGGLALLGAVARRQTKK